MYYQTKNPHGGDVCGEAVTLDYSANTNPLGVPEAVIAAAAEALKRSDGGGEKDPLLALRDFKSKK